ncbi:MAG TPA: aminopeptidase N [Actinomycetales bacterium]|jgi:aminopeptidase N
MPTLTQDEAAERSQLVDVTAYAVDLDLAEAESATTFGSSVVIDFVCAAPGSATFVEVLAEHVDRVELNGRYVDPASIVAGRLPLEGLETQNRLTVSGRFAYSRTGEGLHRFADPEDGLTYLYSQTAMYDAQRVFACFDQPDLKAPLTLSVTAPASWQVIANTAGVRVAVDPEGLTQWEFAASQPLATYFMAVVAGPYQGVTRDHGDVAMGLWCRRSLVPYLRADEQFATTAAGLDYFGDLFAVDYPFGKYDQVFVPEFNLGAMENPGCVTFRDEYFLRRGTVTRQDRDQLVETQLHEMAHMWFGDLVTMRWWDDLWLNESFAEYLAYRASLDAAGNAASWARFAISRKGWGYTADQRSTTHPIAGTVPDTDAAMLNIDGISYAKGASALRQLVEWVGDEAFVRAMRDHVAAHAFGTATLDDLIGTLTEASGRDVRDWAERWLRAAGVSTLEAAYDVGPDGAYTRFAVLQRVPDEHPTLRPHQVGLGLYDLRDGELVRRPVVPVEVEAAARTEVAAMVGAPAADLVLANEGDLTFALLALDDRSRSTVLQHLGLLADPLARAVLWHAVWEETGHGRLTPSELVGLVVRALGEHDSGQLTAAVLGRAVTAADWAGPHRGALREQLAATTLTAAHHGPVGDDRQLAHARTWVSVTGDAGMLRGWLDGREVPAGLDVDVDLRWRVLRRLAVLGAADEADVAAERARDSSSSGALSALGVLAARPSEQAKREAWRQVCDGSLSNHEIAAVTAGFRQADQVDLLRPYVHRYVDELPQLARSGSIELVQLLSGDLFPAAVVEQRTLDLVQGLLDDGALGAAAHRVVSERRDDLRRALVAQRAETSGA